MLGAWSRATAAKHQKQQTEVAQASDKDVSRMFTFREVFHAHPQRPRPLG